LRLDKYGIAAKYYTKADIEKEGYAKIVNVALAENNYDLAREYYEKLGDKKKSSNVYKQAAKASLSKKDYEAAAGFYEKAGDKKGVRKVYNQAAKASLAKENYEKAAAFYEKAEDKKGARNAYSRAAKASLDEGDYEAAVDFYVKAGYKNAKRKVYSQAAKASIAEKNYYKAEIFYKKAGERKKASQMGDLSIVNDSMEKLECACERGQIICKKLKYEECGGRTCEYNIIEFIKRRKNPRYIYSSVTGLYTRTHNKREKNSTLKWLWCK